MPAPVAKILAESPLVRLIHTSASYLVSTQLNVQRNQTVHRHRRRRIRFASGISSVLSNLKPPRANRRYVRANEMKSRRRDALGSLSASRIRDAGRPRRQKGTAIS